jgi:hypothetical protein
VEAVDSLRDIVEGHVEDAYHHMKELRKIERERLNSAIRTEAALAQLATATLGLSRLASAYMRVLHPEVAEEYSVLFPPAAAGDNPPTKDKGKGKDMSGGGGEASGSGDVV